MGVAPGAAGYQREAHHRHLGTSQWSVPERGREGRRREGEGRREGVGRKEERERIGRKDGVGRGREVGNEEGGEGTGSKLTV